MNTTTLLVILVLLYLFKEELAALSGAGQQAGKGLFSVGCLLAIVAVVLLLGGGLGSCVAGGG